MLCPTALISWNNYNAVIFCSLKEAAFFYILYISYSFKSTVRNFCYLFQCRLYPFGAKHFYLELLKIELSMCVPSYNIVRGKCFLKSFTKFSCHVLGIILLFLMICALD